MGDNSLTNRLLPVQIGTATDWAQVSAGGAHSLAIKTNGTLWSWGDNFTGQLGNGTSSTAPTLFPTQIGTATDWTAISAGYIHSIALKSNNSIRVWGSNTSGQLGDNTSTAKFVPTAITNGTNISKIKASRLHTLVIKTNGSLWSWGSNMQGQLGDNTFVNKLIPTQIGSDLNWTEIASAGFFTVARKTTGTLWSWGMDSGGQLGRGAPFVNNPLPTQIGTATNWQSISAGTHFTVAQYTPSAFFVNVASWGLNPDGQIGHGIVIANVPTPTTINTCNILLSNESFEQTTFSVFPNPANDFINIQNDDNLKIDNLSIYDISGKKNHY